MDKLDKYEKYIQLLETNKNLILTGAPGTGKTFMAREIAKAFILKNAGYYLTEERIKDDEGVMVQKRNTDLVNKYRCMVHFHPSYDYSDFVEGLRPIIKSDDQIAFKRVNGVFKDFCVKSLDAITVKRMPFVKCDEHIYANGHLDAAKKMFSNDGNFENNSFINNYRDDEKENNEVDILNKFDERLFDDINWLECSNNSFWLFEHLVKSEINIFRDGFCYPSQEDIEIAIRNNDYYWRGNIKNYNITKLAKSYERLFSWIINYAKSHYELTYHPTVFIIDGINRGEISKIFGELYFSIDPGYRGEFDANGYDNKVQTQYQNMIDDGDAFKNGFYVPENVYIIGTMNNIDSSVGNMDFAIRRLFAWAEVTPEESYQNMIADNHHYMELIKTEIHKRMISLNDAILKPELGLGEVYQIGAGYFRKVFDYSDLLLEQALSTSKDDNNKQPGWLHAFSLLWENHLKGLLFEYLRGNQNVKAQLEALKEAFVTQGI